MDPSKNNRLSTEEAINYISRTKKRKTVPVCEMLEPSGSFQPYSSNFIMESEDSSIKRQLYDPSII